MGIPSPAKYKASGSTPLGARGPREGDRPASIPLCQSSPTKHLLRTVRARLPAPGPGDLFQKPRTPFQKMQQPQQTRVKQGSPNPGSPSQVHPLLAPSSGKASGGVARQSPGAAGRESKALLTEVAQADKVLGVIICMYIHMCACDLTSLMYSI